MEKSAGAFRTISEVSAELDVPQHVLRFWEQKFPQIKPLKRGGGRRYYRPADIELIRTIRRLLYAEGYTIRGVQRLLKTQGIRALGQDIDLTPSLVVMDLEAAGPDGLVPDAEAAGEPERTATLQQADLSPASLLDELRLCKFLLDEALDATATL